jgi:hypothetical protein
MRRVGILSVLILVVGVLVLWTAPSYAAEQTRTVRYGPFTIPAGTMDSPGMLHNQFRLAVNRPCLDCYITSFTPDLVDGLGETVTMEDGPMLHHAVLTSQWRADATCSGQWLGLAGERLFASGDERTVAAMPPGYGYRVRWYDSWNLLVDLMNHSTQAQTVYFEVTFKVRASWESVKPVKPVWLDIDQCGDSEYSIPAGYSDEHWDWTVNVPGKVVSMLGHVHGHGLAVEATNESEGGSSICRSVATPDPDDLHRIMRMTTCVADPVAVLKAGQTVRLHSEYNASHPADDVMGIMLAYIHRQP